MDPGSDDCRVPRPGETVGVGGQEADAADLIAEGTPPAQAESLSPWDEEASSDEADEYLSLPPTPDWMRKPPRRRDPRQLRLFD